MTATIRVTRVHSGEDFDIGPDVDGRSRELMNELHRRTSQTERSGRELVECRMHDDSAHPELRARRGRCDHGSACRRVHGIFVALVKRHAGTPDEEWTVSHVDKIASHKLRVGESTEHKREKHEWCTAFATVGYSADTEVAISSGSVCDVLVAGPAGRFDIEVQRYGQSVPVTKGRTTRIRRGGVEPVWSADRLTLWNESNAVPNVRTNDLSTTASPRDDWTIVGGLRRVEVVPCHPRYGSCPLRPVGRWCGGKHPRLEPLPGVRVYEVAERLPAGDLVAVTVAGKSQSEVLMSPSDRDLYVELGGLLVPRKVLTPERPTQAQVGVHDTWEPREGFGVVLDRRQSMTLGLSICATPTCGEKLLLPGADRRVCARCDPGAFRCINGLPARRVQWQCARCGQWMSIEQAWLCPSCDTQLLRGAAS